MTSQRDLTETEELLRRLDQGDDSALEQLLALHRDYLKRIIELRMENQLQGRIDASDVVQETQLVVSKRIQDFLNRRTVSFRVWLRCTAMERLVDLRRRHLAQKRSVYREVRISEGSSLAIARRLLSGRPSEAIQLKELSQQVRDAIERLNEFDREILLLRYVEELSNTEVAELLEIDPATARKRHGRAIRRLGQQLVGFEFIPD